MATLKDIQRRIKSVKNTQQITKAMKMVSAAKLRRAQEEIVAARPYADKISDIVASLSENVKHVTHPLLNKGKTGKVELIILTSDRGLCGGFNSNILRAAERFINENPELEVSVNTIGRRSVDYFKRRTYNVTGQRPLGTKRPEYSLAETVGREVIDNYTNDISDETYIIYGEFISAMTQETVVKKLLPVVTEDEEKESEEKSAMDGGFLFEPDEEGVLDSLLPKYVEVQIFRAILESSASEHGARMTAMESASRNASDMIDKLTLIYNRARQAAITKELMEIIGGAEALKG
ncbi:MAG: ATP synthase F1 subunit gamma [Deltaproteobacteria bacterium]|nr:ATP synthase F1 subunit gamma [Deltaproteobacteria bacterium]